MFIFRRRIADSFEKIKMKLLAKAAHTLDENVLLFNKIKNSRGSNKRPMILFVKDRGCNVPYLIQMLRYLEVKNLIKVTAISINDFSKVQTDAFDLLIYQTWSCEQGHNEKSDEYFYKFQKPKILFDAHASGSFDTYKRFNDKTIPRIKNAPHVDFIKNYNVIAYTTHPTQMIKPKIQKKEIDLSYCVGLQTHPIRPEIFKVLEGCKDRFIVDLDKNKHAYQIYLRRVKISVNAPGYGEGTFRHLYSLNAGSLMLAHDSIIPIKLLPHADLEEGLDYIAFNMSNLNNKIEEYLKCSEQREEVALNGFKKFIKGYSIPKSALNFYQDLQYLLS